MLEQVAVAAGLTRAVKPGIAASRLALRRLRLFGTFDMRWVQLGDTTAFTAADIEDLEEFLDQRDTRALLSVLAMTLLMPASDARVEALATVHDFFVNLAQQRRANKSSKWLDRSEEVWASLVQIYDHATPAGKALTDAAVEYEDFLRTPLVRGETAGAGSKGQDRYIGRLSELCADINRVANGISAAEEIKVAIAASPAPPIITYTSTTKPATFKDLYVSRTLVEKASGREVEGLQLGNRGAPYRAVVHGAPGAGKSTFVRNLRQELAADPDAPPALLLTARRYFPAAEHQAIVEHLGAGLRNSLSLDLSDGQVRDILTLGLAVVVFDGLDEVTDINQRLELVQRISSFASEFPAVSVLVTSRSIGYERAPLPAKTFVTLVLNEYTPSQAQEYVERWFTYIERSDLVPDFERESTTVSDLKENPLLLSLLCILYRERGSIPRRRRDIYQQCADLLFHTWDSHRHIDQPEELHANGDRIMQELARWVFQSQKAQNGLPESVIKKTIGIYLRDAVGVEEGEARRRAGEFLEFCATRAWLLGTTGTDHGERLFGFTHRTFFEYFTAEAVSRTSGDPAIIAETLIAAHKRDATSVLPELLLQAVDEKLDRGAAMTFRKVCEATDDELLIMRLMEGVPLPAPTRAKGFDRILDLWTSRCNVPRSSFAALLSLNVDARNQFCREYLAENLRGAAGIFLGAWATLDLNGGTDRYAPLWADVVASLVANPHNGERAWYDSSVAVWRWRAGLGSMPTARNSIFITQGTSGQCVGTLWLGLEVAGSSGDATETLRQELDTLFAVTVSTVRGPRHKLSRPVANEFTSASLARVRSRGFPSTEPLEGEALAAFLYATAVIYEASWYDSDLQEELLEKLPSPAQALWRRREAAAEDDGRGTARPPRLPDTLPRWIRDWGEGKRAFTEMS